MDQIVMLLTIIYQNAQNRPWNALEMTPTYPHILAKIQKTVEYFSILQKGREST